MHDGSEKVRNAWDWGWDAVALLVTVAVAVVVPLRLAFAPAAQPLGWVSDLAVTAVFLLDALLRRPARLRPRPSGPRPRLDLRGGPLDSVAWWVVVDLLPALPLGPLLGVPALALARLAKLGYLLPVLRSLHRSTVLHPTVMRLGTFVFWVLLLAHWLACGWIAIDGARATVAGSPYLSALYWCVTTLTTVGYGDVTPETRTQTVYTMVVMLLGVGVYGYVIGNIATLLTRVDMAKAQYVATLERLAGFLRYKRVPAPMQEHIFDYYRYLWENRLGYDEAKVLDDLPPTLRRELSLALNRHLIQKVDFLEGASLGLVRDLCLELRPSVHPPGDLIVRAGDYGRHLYFISRGSVEVISSDGTTVLRTLSDGDFFGELALLHSLPRTASVRALEYCDLYTLDRASFERVVALYPEFAERIRSISADRTIQGSVRAPPATTPETRADRGPEVDARFAGALAGVRARLREKGRVTYRALAREFGLEEGLLADVAHELIEAEGVARDEGGTVLVRVDDDAPA